MLLFFFFLFKLRWQSYHQQTDVYLLMCLYIWLFKPRVTLLQDLKKKKPQKYKTESSRNTLYNIKIYTFHNFGNKLYNCLKCIYKHLMHFQKEDLQWSKRKNRSAFDCFSPCVGLVPPPPRVVSLLSVVQPDLPKGLEWMKGNAASP